MRTLHQSQLLLASSLLIIIMGLAVLWRGSTTASPPLHNEVVEECVNWPALRESAPCVDEGLEPMDAEVQLPRDETPMTRDPAIQLRAAEKENLEIWEKPVLNMRPQGVIDSGFVRSRIATRVSPCPIPLDVALARPCPFDLPVGEFRKIPFQLKFEKGIRKRRRAEASSSTPAMTTISFAPQNSSSIITLDEKDDTLGFKVWQHLDLPDPRSPYLLEIEAGFSGYAQVMAYTHAEDLASYHLVAEGALGEGNLLSLPLRTPTSRHRLVLVVSCRPREDGPFQAQLFQQPWPQTPIMYKLKGRNTKE